MATPNLASFNNGESLPLFPNQHRPEHFAEQDRVLALYYRTWMDEPQLISGVISDIHQYDKPAKDGSPGFVSLKTAKTADNRTGSITGIDMNSVALIPEAALPHIKHDDFLETWLANGSEAWPGARTMLEQALRQRIAEGSIGWDMPREEEHEDAYGHHHPTRTRKHLQTVPGSIAGKVRHARLRELREFPELPEN